eukprot:6188276-Pleurochrysis_carterae.AAC.3
MCDALPAATPETTIIYTVKSFCVLVMQRSVETPVISRDTGQSVKSYQVSRAHPSTSCNQSLYHMLST